MPVNEEQEELVQRAIEQAKQYHSVMDAARTWGHSMETELLVEAALEDDEETAAEIERVADIVRTVPRRIEQGENAISRRP